jgi:hypothetical protein
MRKRRTRQHQIEDLSYNFVEKQVLLSFFVFRKYAFRDYGYDGTITTFKENGEVEPGVIFVQVKATEKLKFSKKHNGYRLPLSSRDLELWLNEPTPVVIVFYEALRDKAYFVELHEHFKENRLTLRNINKTKSIYLAIDNLFVPDAVLKFRHTKNIKLWNP